MALRGTANAANTTTSGSIVVTVSGIGIQQNDVVLLCVDGGGGGTNTFTYPTGFNPISGLTNISLNGGTTAGIALKIATASEPSSYTISSTATDYLTAHCRAYSGRSGVVSAVAQTAATSAGTTSPQTYTMTGLTAVALDDIIIIAYTDNADNQTGGGYTFVAAPGFANATTAFGNVTYSPIVGGCDDVAAAGGATGTLSPTLTFASNHPNFYAGYVLSLAVAAAAGGSSGLSRGNKLSNDSGKLWSGETGLWSGNAGLSGNGPNT